ncbi:hypothetical protein NHX12_022520 [Muraenolepis orangiensis]|uniref:Uncharacterized protein n=1 Tax=Muraenolepis orangiensis TaxID=630683 RepID=A0A9Q0ERN9_9TELE|nr:hypothetical protein NHX12_022520 [Muraenolepis orangiensis]
MERRCLGLTAPTQLPDGDTDWGQLLPGAPNCEAIPPNLDPLNPCPPPPPSTPLTPLGTHPLAPQTPIAATTGMYTIGEEIVSFFSIVDCS